MRHHYLVSYDIADPSRLRKVHRTVRDFGDAIQLSVFGCQLSDKDVAVLESRLLDVIDQKQDQVLLVKLTKATRTSPVAPGIQSLGRKVSAGLVRVIIV